jgi:peptidyl-dipeptidase A
MGQVQAWFQGILVAVVITGSVASAQPAPAAGASPPTPAQAQAFVTAAEAKLLDLWTASERANWVAATYITDDTEILAAQAAERATAAATTLAKAATRFDGLKLPADVARKLLLLKTAPTLASPADPREGAELARLVAGMEGAYGKGKYCPPGGECLDLQQLSRIMATSRKPAELLDAWRGWHAIAPPLRKDFTRYAELGNRGARELGFADLGALWRAKYDMSPDDFALEVDRLWEQVKPLYLALHAYVRSRLVATYGADVVPPQGPIPAHLLGNMWAQSWENLYPLVAPKDADPGYDLSALLRAATYDPLRMVRSGERFFTSLGFEPLPATFWERSMFVKPRDREVVCHASAWDIDWQDDLRLKMCIEITGEDFRTIHHELGHNFYQRAYSQQPVLFRDSANDGFHEAIGDTIALSVTPAYLVRVGLLDKEPPETKDVGLLLQMALEKVAFLPFGLLVDQWRWRAFSGVTPPERYNTAWWELRAKYQGVAPPVTRSETDFDPGAKYHVAANVSYTRYFLAAILQFQFHRALCQTAGAKGPLHRCSIYDNAEAGRRLRAALAMGRSRPWPDVMEALTGQRQMDATAILEYFAPLKRWLDEQNRGLPVGW